MNAPKGQSQIGIAQKMVHRIEIRRDEIHRAGEEQAADVLLQETNARPAAAPRRDSEHSAVAIYRKNRNAPAPIQIAGEQSSAAAHIGGVAEFDSVLSDDRVRWRISFIK